MRQSLESIFYSLNVRSPIKNNMQYFLNILKCKYLSTCFQLSLWVQNTKEKITTIFKFFSSILLICSLRWTTHTSKTLSHLRSEVLRLPVWFVKGKGGGAGARCVRIGQCSPCALSHVSYDALHAHMHACTCVTTDAYRNLAQNPLPFSVCKSRGRRVCSGLSDLQWLSPEHLSSIDFHPKPLTCRISSPRPVQSNIGGWEGNRSQNSFSQS